MTPVPDVPVAAPISETTAEDTAKAITLLGSDPDGDTLSYTVTQAAHGTVTLLGDVATYTPAANYNGPDSFTYRAIDDTHISNVATVSLSVTPINDAPSFLKGGNQTVTEDAGAQTVSGWATSISAGPANEIAQAVDFLVSNDNNALFASQPVIAPNGTLTYTPMANTSGSATVSVRIHDDGGTTDGGADTSAVQTFSITVNPGNDAPTVADIDDVITNEDTAEAITLLGSDVDGDILTYEASDPANGTVSIVGAVATYTPDANYYGSDSFTYTADDGPATSDPATVTITVSAVNDAPSFVKGGNQTVAEDAGAQTVSAWATAISAGPTNESAQAVDFLVTNDNNALFSIQPAVAPNGTLTYTPDANAERLGHGERAAP